jgi:hypothetical protein
MTPRVAFATAPAATVGNDDTDRPRHDAAFAAEGIALAHCVWSDPAVDWAAFDLVVVRSTWDYLAHLDGFRAWLAAMDRLGNLANPAPVIAWNLDKTYLVDLAAAGVPVVPTRVCHRMEAVEEALAGLPGERVVKPVVSAGSQRTGRFGPGDVRAAELAAAILAGGTDVLVQPAVPSVATEGEVCTLVFDGRVSHAARRGPLLALGGGLVGGTYTERVAPEPPTAARASLVAATVSAVADIVGDRFGVAEPLLYARVDLVALEDGTEAVLEVELAEPSFFLDTAPAAAATFAAAVRRRTSGAPAPRTRSGAGRDRPAC